MPAPVPAIGGEETKPLIGGVLSAPPPAAPAALAAVDLSGEVTFFYAMEGPDGSRIEFDVEAAGQSLPVKEGHPPLLLTPSGRCVETATHKLIQMDGGESELFDNVTDPDGLTNLAADPAQAANAAALAAKLAEFPAAAPAPVEAIPMGPVGGAPEVPKVSAPGPTAPMVPMAPPVPALTEVPDFAAPAKPILPAPGPKLVAGKITLPEPGLPKPSEVPKLELPETPKVLESSKPAGGPPPVPGKPVLPKVGPPPTPDTPNQGAPAKPALPPLPSVPKSGDLNAPTPPIPAELDVPMPKKLVSEKSYMPESSEPLQPALPILKNDDETDPDIEFEKGTAPPPEPKAKPIDAKGASATPPAMPRRPKKVIDPVDSKRKSRIEAETAVKNAQIELGEARAREELMAREELEAHKTALERARKELAQLDGEIDKVKKTDTAKLEKNHAALEKLKQEYEHNEDLVRHTIRAKKASHLDHEDRLTDLDHELHRLHEEETDRIRSKEAEDIRREEESRAAHERYLERVKTDEEEVVHHQADIEKLEDEEVLLKDEIAIKEQKFQTRAKEIKFEEDDEHSRFEHEQEVLLKRREKFEEQVNIEGDEIAAMNAKLDARKIVRADEKKMERLQVVAEHEADIIQKDRTEDDPVKVAKSVIDRELPPSPDEEPPLPKSGEAEPLPKPKIAKPVAMPTMPKPVALPEDKPELPALPKAAGDKPALPVLPTFTGDKPELPTLPKPAGDKPALPVLPTFASDKPGLPALPKPAGDKPALPVLPMPAAVAAGPAPVPGVAEAPEPKKGFFGKLFSKKKKDGPADPSAALPEAGPDAPKPTLPPMPGPGGSGGDAPKLVLPAFPASPAGGPFKPELPPTPAADSVKDMEQEMLKNKLQRIAQDRADRLREGESAETPTLPALPSPPKPGGAPRLPPLPGGGALKPTLPPLPQSGGGGMPNLPPLPGPLSIENEADQQTRDQEKDS